MKMGDWKKTFIEAEQYRGEAGLQTTEPMRLQIVHYVTMCLFFTGSVLIISAICGIFTLQTGGWWAVISGGCVGVEAIIAGAVVTWLGRGLSNTAIAQGYLVVGVLSVVSCTGQMVILTLLAILTPTISPVPHIPLTQWQENMWAWIQFLGGAQGALAVLLGGMIGGAICVTSCCCKAPKDNVVGIYHPR